MESVSFHRLRGVVKSACVRDRGSDVRHGYIDATSDRGLRGPNDNRVVEEQVFIATAKGRYGQQTSGMTAIDDSELKRKTMGNWE